MSRRIMSVRYAEAQVRRRTKLVTRRGGWSNLKVGAELWLTPQGMGLPKGAKVERIAHVSVVDVRREPLSRLLDDPVYGDAEMVLEGFPGLAPDLFIARYFTPQRIGVADQVTRIQWIFLPVACGRGICAGNLGHEGTCAEASGWFDPTGDIALTHSTEGNDHA